MARPRLRSLALVPGLTFSYNVTVGIPVSIQFAKLALRTSST